MYCFNCRLVGPVFQSDELALETLPTHLQLSKEREGGTLGDSSTALKRTLFDSSPY